MIIDDNGERTQGLLSRFIEDRVKRYVAPSRRGIPRGEPIGFSERKHKGILLSLSSTELTKQAEILEVSYELLRKWRSEDRFLEEVERYATEFAEIIYLRFIEAVGKYGSQMTPIVLKEYRNKVFNDLHRWGLTTRDHVVKWLLQQMGIKDPERFLGPLIACMEIMMEDPKFRRRMERRCISYLNQEIIKICSRPEISEDDRRNVLIMSDAIKKWLNE